MQDRSCEVLVIGAGGAGLRAAISASHEGAKVLLVTKGTLGESGVTAQACSDRMAFHTTLPQTEPKGPDNWKYHAQDIYRIGGYVSDEDLAQILAKGSEDAFQYLNQAGVPWVKREDGNPDQFVTDGSEFARACYTGPRTATHIEEALVKKLLSTSVQVIEHVMLADLIVVGKEHRVVGAIGATENTGEMIVIRAKAVILATGGAGQVFETSVFPEGMTGDGYAMAYRVGAELVNMEFIQIGLSSLKTQLACSGSMMRAFPRVINEHDVEILSSFFPCGTPPEETYNVLFDKGASWPLSFDNPSHIIDVGIAMEVSKGNRVFLDYSRNPEAFSAGLLRADILAWYKERTRTEGGCADTPLLRLRAINEEAIEWLSKHGINLNAGDLVEIAPAIQHFQGGVKIRRNGQSTLPGLFAAGECAGGQHGANRPGGNSLLDGQVFGKIAGKHAAAYAKEKRPVGEKTLSVDAFTSMLMKLKQAGGLSATTVREKSQQLAYQAAGVIRTKQGLARAQRRLEELEMAGLRIDRNGTAYALETRNILLLAKIILAAAKEREESRGPHLFFDHAKDKFPLNRDDEKWSRYIVIRREGKRLSITSKQPVRMKEYRKVPRRLYHSTRGSSARAFFRDVLRFRRKRES